MVFEPWRALPGKGVLFVLNLFSAVALVYEGYVVKYPFSQEPY